MNKRNNLKWQHLALWLIMLGLLAACGSAGTEPAADDAAGMEEMDGGAMNGMEEMDDGEMEEMDHGDGTVQRVPNEGAVIKIISPADGETFDVSQQILVEVEVENFELGEAGNHWHVYVDGTSWGMVMGANTDQPLTGLTPGEHEISVFMSTETHEELEDGDSVTITVTE